MSESWKNDEEEEEEEELDESVGPPFSLSELLLKRPIEL